MDNPSEIIWLRKVELDSEVGFGNKVITFSCHVITLLLYYEHDDRWRKCLDSWKVRFSVCIRKLVSVIECIELFVANRKATSKMQGGYVNNILQHFLEMQFAYCTHQSKSCFNIRSKKLDRKILQRKQKFFCRIRNWTRKVKNGFQTSCKPSKRTKKSLGKKFTSEAWQIDSKF